MSHIGDHHTTMFRLADRVMNGELETTLRRWRSANVSLRSIQVLLEQELGVKPALETVRRWVRDLPPLPDDENGRAA